MVCSRDGRRKRRFVHGLVKHMQLSGLHLSVVTKKGVFKPAKRSIFKLVLVLILSYGHESWAMTERLVSHVQAA